jgi:hypothetical protein
MDSGAFFKISFKGGVVPSARDNGLIDGGPVDGLTVTGLDLC